MSSVCAFVKRTVICVAVALLVACTAKIVQLQFDEEPPEIPDNYCDDPEKKWFDASVKFAGGKVKIKENLYYGKDVFKTANGQYMEDIRVYRRFFRDPKYMGRCCACIPPREASSLLLQLIKT
jgi:hypothetical protein